MPDCASTLRSVISHVLPDDAIFGRTPGIDLFSKIARHTECISLCATASFIHGIKAMREDSGLSGDGGKKQSPGKIAIFQWPHPRRAGQGDRSIAGFRQIPAEEYFVFPSSSPPHLTPS